MRALNDPALWLCAMNLAFIAALPRIFFRRGSRNVHWWLTAAPFILAGAGPPVARHPRAGLDAAERPGARESCGDRDAGGGIDVRGAVDRADCVHARYAPEAGFSLASGE